MMSLMIPVCCDSRTSRESAPEVVVEFFNLRYDVVTRLEFIILSLSNTLYPRTKLAVILPEDRH